MPSDPFIRDDALELARTAARRSLADVMSRQAEPPAQNTIAEAEADPEPEETSERELSEPSADAASYDTALDITDIGEPAAKKMSKDQIAERQAAGDDP